MEQAPLHDDVAFGPEGGRAFWARAADGVRLRLAHWPAHPGLAHRGTVLLLNGRSEFVEKYGTTARELAAMGYDTVSLDWRGQGLSERPGCADPMVGHVRDFAEYQLDLDALRAAVDELGLAGPLFLLAHSMGGAIGLRALHRGLDVRAAAFSAPMWEILMAPHLRPLSWIASGLACLMGQECRLAPGTRRETYVDWQPFEDNQLTTDPDRYLLFRKQAELYPELVLGGPSMGWLLAALRETRALRRLPAPEIPAIAFLGTNERIVEPRAIRAGMEKWGPDGKLEIIEDAEHEVLMERPEIRVGVNASLARLFSGHDRDPGQ